MQSFWSLPGYYRKFIANNSETAKSLSDLRIEAELGVFGLKQVESFKKLEKTLWTIPMVRFFKHSTPLELHTLVKGEERRLIQFTNQLMHAILLSVIFHNDTLLKLKP
ncbi:hypothetical protein NPIL_344291 [Nephila pilipes]|uniref:Uncharacterized protein n=1 Tax=Nephila pilipes TaxID=299642 RepID=A0A8X6TV30_NEPPI|nr:hypothetical protein NPIL_344291 [Nephila pilipes]